MNELINRHRKVYTRDRVAFLMSFLSVIILILLYQFFLGEMQINNIKAEMHTDFVSEAARRMTHNWLIAGLVTMTSMTIPLGAFSPMVHDREKKIDEDFRITPFSPLKIELSYAIFAILFGILVTFLTCLLALLVFNGLFSLGQFTFVEYLFLFGIIVLSVLLSTVIILLLLTFIHTISSLSTLSTIIGTLIGFLVGVYIPIGSVGKTIQQVMTWFPLTQINSLLRQLLMKDAMSEVFKDADSASINAYKESYGVILSSTNGNHLSTLSMFVYLFIVLMVFTLLIVLLKFFTGRKSTR